jgi:glycerol-3-phosphate dehydrogenase
MKSEYDLVIIGGGINGCGIARDAAGRGLAVLLVEQDDLASATSSWSSKLIHGGLRYLEQYEFRLVREALQEREVLLRIAPHLVHPLEFILPHDDSMRPAWMIRIGLWMYDHIGGNISLPGSRGVAFPDRKYSAGLKADIRRGFFYSDARVDDARLTLLNAVSAREHGADVLTRTRCVAGRRHGGCWEITLQNADSGERFAVAAKGVINAAGPWVKHLLDDALNIPMAATVKLVKGSHIIVPRVHNEDHAYILQNDDRRVAFIIPFEERYSLIGTTDVSVGSIDEARVITDEETAYLVRAVNRFLAKPVRESDVIWSYAGVRPLYDDGSVNPSEITRDYVFKIDQQDGKLPLLSIFGGKITTYRKLAEHALKELRPFYADLGGEWTDGEALPGGDFSDAAGAVRALQSRYPKLPGDFIAKVFSRHGTRSNRVLGNATSLDDLKPLFGRGANQLCAREIEYLVREEWARGAEDILWRRSKCGLHLAQSERDAAAAHIRQAVERMQAGAA